MKFTNLLYSIGSSNIGDLVKLKSGEIVSVLSLDGNVAVVSFGNRFWGVNLKTKVKRLIR